MPAKVSEVLAGLDLARQLGKAGDWCWTGRIGHSRPASRSQGPGQGEGCSGACEGSGEARSGAGEAGTAGAPAAVMNAINDALRPLGAKPLTHMPFTPGRILQALGRIGESAPV